MFLSYVLVFWPQSMWDLSSPSKDGTHTDCIEKQNLNCWIAREVSLHFFLTLAQWLNVCMCEHTHNETSRLPKIIIPGLE